MTVNIQEIGNIIRWHRQKAGLTQLELADIAGIGKATVFDIEKGKESVRLVNLIKVLNTLNISIQLISPITGLDKSI